MRKYRELSDLHKQRISQSLTGKHLSDQHKANISKGMRDYWTTIPNKPQGENNGETSNNDATKEQG